MATRYNSDALAAIHQMMAGFHESGAIDAQTMREFDEKCLADYRDTAPDESSKPSPDSSRIRHE